MFRDVDYVLGRGVGANCVHVILMKKMLGWEPSGSEILEESRSVGQNILDKNNIEMKIIAGEKDRMLLMQGR